MINMLELYAVRKGGFFTKFSKNACRVKLSLLDAVDFMKIV